MSIKKRGRIRALRLSSKSQVSIFMILALIIILGGVLYFFYQRLSVEREVEIVHPDIAPIREYIENCIKSAAEDGLDRIGLSGGYITVPDSIGKNPRAYLSNPPGSGFKIPYWWHDGITSIPTEDLISQQLASYIKLEIKNCINNFEPFAERFSINELKEKSVDVKLNENDVSISMYYPLEIAAKDGKLKNIIQNFAHIAPIRLKKVYELAKLLMERENNEYFLERKTIDLYSMDVDIPTTDVEATCKAKTWRLSEIRRKLMTLLRVNLPYIRIKGTDYNPNLYVPNPNGKSVYSETYFQHHYVWDIDKDADKKYKNMKVAFAYDDWPLFIYARPSQNGILSSNAQKGSDALSFFCLHIWHFTYDIGYPVMVTIFDQESKDNKPFQFSFAFRVSIDHNQPKRINTGTTLFEIEPDISSEEYCNSLQNEITIFTVNNATGDDLQNVELTFACGRYYCDMGQSDWLSLGAAAGITKRFPYCVNGIIKGAKDGFEESRSFIQTDVDGKSYLLLLNPIREFKNYKVVKHLLSSPGAVGNAEELAENEKVSIQIKGKNIGFEAFAAYPKEGDFSIRLPDGRDAVYEVAIYVADEENIVGGYIGEWKLSKEELSGASEIVFHVIEQGEQGAGAGTDDERALFISGLSSYSKSIPPPEVR